MTTNAVSGKPRRRFHGADVYASVSVCPPPCRMLLVVCDRDQGEGGKEIYSYPVVGIRSAVCTRYVKSAHPDVESPPRGATHEDLIELGYRVDILGCHLDEDVLVIADVDGVDAVYTADQVASCSWVYGYRIVACNWPPGRDTDEILAIGRAIIKAGSGHGSTSDDTSIRIEPETSAREES